MAIERTAKGTALAKTSGTTLTISDIKIKEGRSLIVGCAFDNAQGPPVIKYGRREMKRRILQKNDGSGLTVGIWTAPWIVHPVLRDIVATWGAAIGARAMVATVIHEAGKVDVSQSRQLDATAAPATGIAVTTTEADTIHLAFFASKGPVSDTAGTSGLGHTLGQRVGTVGVPPVSNVTLQETYEILSATGDCRATLSGATERDWASVIIAFKARETYTITAAYERNWVVGPTHDRVIFRYEGDAGKPYQTYLEIDIFDNMTDDEVKEFIRKSCAWHAQHILEDEMEIMPDDTARGTRLAAFVNQKITV